MASARVSAMPRIAFFTSAWERDWRIVLDPARFEANLASNAYDFPVRLVVLNNFDSRETAQRARAKADDLVARGLATDVAVFDEVLSDNVISGFGLNPAVFWRQNPYFTTAHLTALTVLAGRCDYAFFLNGDVWLRDRSDWVGRAVSALAGRDDVRGLNICRNIYRDLYPQWAYGETDDLWLSEPPPPCYPDPRTGFSLSDHAYLLDVTPGGEKWRFSNEPAELEPFYAHFPAYAQPCFEAFIMQANARDGIGHAALKPRPGPVSMHKKGLPKSQLKLSLYLALGYFRPGGKWAPPRPR